MRCKIGDPLKKVQAGQKLKIPARTWNTFIDAAQDYQNRTRNLGGDAAPMFTDHDVVPLYNYTGVDLPRFSAVGLRPPIIYPADNLQEFKNRVNFYCSAPAAFDADAGRFAILLEPIGADKIGKALVSGVCQVVVDVVNESHQRADVVYNQTSYLESRWDGTAQILWKESGTGQKWATVRLGNRWNKLRRFEMMDSRDPGDTTSVQEIYWEGSQYTAGASPVWFNVIDFSKQFSKMPTTAGDRGAFGWAAFREDYNEWKIISMQTPGDFWGELTQDLPQSAGGIYVNKVGSVFSGYDVFQANHGNQILVANPAGGGNFAGYWFAGKSGDRVLCRWNMVTGQYFIVAIEPNNAGYQTLEVVTDVDFGAQTVTKKTIELAPWTTIA